MTDHSTEDDLGPFQDMVEDIEDKLEKDSKEAHDLAWQTDQVWPSGDEEVRYLDGSKEAIRNRFKLALQMLKRANQIVKSDEPEDRELFLLTLDYADGISRLFGFSGMQGDRVLISMLSLAFCAGYLRASGRPE